MRMLRSFATLAFCALTAGAAFATPVVYNAASDFTTASNPNGVWTYGYGASAAPLTVSGPAYSGNAGFAYWTTSEGFPIVGHNSNSSPVPGYTPAPPTTDIWMHPANSDSLPAQLVFTVPTTDQYTIDALFERADLVSGGNGVGIAIYLNGTALLSRTILSGDYLNSISFLQTLTLNAGDQLFFAVDPNGEFSYDSTGLNLNITEGSPIPEPSSVLLVATGLASVVAATRRKLFS